MNDGSEKKSFWVTLPGILTGIAAIITAVAGLLLILHQVGFFEKDDIETVEAPKIELFSASPARVNRGEFSTLSWHVSDATNVTLDSGIGGVPLAGSKSVAPSKSTTYTLSAKNETGRSVYATTEVIVNGESPEEFSQQRSYAGDCSKRPEGSVCISYEDGYVWLVNDAIIGWRGGGTLQGKKIVVARGRRADYHHILGTQLVKKMPK